MKPEILHKIKTAPLEQKSETFARFCLPLKEIKIPELKSAGNRPLEFEFENQLYSLLYFHTKEFKSGRELLQNMSEDDFAKAVIAPEKELKKSTFFDAINHRGMEQLQVIMGELASQNIARQPCEYKELGKLVAIDGSLMTAVLTMKWADYRKGAKKAKMHVGFDINHGIPKSIVLSDGKADEKDYVANLIGTGETAVMDRYYQCHKNFDLWQDDDKPVNFICRIKAGTTKTIHKELPVKENSPVFYDALVYLGSSKLNRTKKPVRVIGYQIGGSVYWLATNRLELTAEQIALAYKLRWDIENFFQWFKCYLNVYHVLARSEYGFTVQILSGIIFFLLFSLYCMKFFKQKPSLFLLRKLRHDFYNDFLLSFARFSNQFAFPQSSGIP